MPKGLPYYKMWVKDFDTNENVRMLNLSEAGLFLFALNHAWINDGLPADSGDVGRVLRLTVREVKTVWPRVAKCFTLCDDGRLRNHRQEEEREYAKAKSKQASEAVAERERKRIERSIGRSSDDDLRVYGSGSGSDCTLSFKDENGEKDFELTPDPRGLVRPDVSTKKSRKADHSTEEIKKSLGSRIIWWEAFWSIYPCHDGRKPAMEVYERKVHDRELAADIHRGAKRYAAKCGADPTIKVKYAQGWLNDERWKDEGSISPTPKDTPRLMCD